MRVINVNPATPFGFMVGLALGVMPVVGARAAVIDAQPNGFAIEETTHVAAAPQKVYDALIRPEKWWNALHTYTGNSANLSLEAKAGGCLCEALPDGGSVMHATVVNARPGKALRLRGPLGPFQGEGVASAITFTLKPSNGGTDLVLDNNVGGYVKGGFDKLPQAADAMLMDLVARLKLFAETGRAMPQDKPRGK
jgi:uncharacterized protein YndB with AHSA1/START domain